jgi:hypothetical protein
MNVRKTDVFLADIERHYEWDVVKAEIFRCVCLELKGCACLKIGVESMAGEYDASIYHDCF